MKKRINNPLNNGKRIWVCIIDQSDTNIYDVESKRNPQRLTHLTFQSISSVVISLSNHKIPIGYGIGEQRKDDNEAGKDNGPQGERIGSFSWSIIIAKIVACFTSLRSGWIYKRYEKNVRFEKNAFMWYWSITSLPLANRCT